jgi:hypothetical protein
MPLCIRSIVFLALLMGPGLSVAQDDGPVHVIYPFGGVPLPAAFKLTGPDAQNFVKVEREGVRITLPAKRNSTQGAGLSLPMLVRGDFEISTRYEILKMDPPVTGHGVGFQLYIESVKDIELDFLRIDRVAEGESYVRTLITTRNGKKNYEMGFFATSAKVGQLKLTRSRSQVTLWAAEKDGEFAKLESVQFGGDDVKTIRVSAFTGHEARGVDLRVKDLRIRSAGGNVAGANPRPIGIALEQWGWAPIAMEPEELPSPRGSRLWWAMVVLIAFVALALLALAVWMVRSRRQPSGASNSAEGTSALTFACSECGRKLKTKVAQAGKSIQCPSCGKVVEVSASS